MIGCFPNQFTKDVKTRKKSQYLHIIWGEGNVSNWYDSYIISVAGVTVNGIAPEHATETTQFLKYPVSVSGNTHVDWVVFYQVVWDVFLIFQKEWQENSKQFDFDMFCPAELDR